MRTIKCCSNATDNKSQTYRMLLGTSVYLNAFTISMIDLDLRYVTQMACLDVEDNRNQEWIHIL